MLILAVIPSAILFYVIWRCDREEKEPVGLLIRLLVFGALSIIPALFFELFLEEIYADFFPAHSYVAIFIDNFIGTSLIEEGAKYFILRKSTWKHPAFNYTFDAVVYSVTASLGFATVENIVYVLDGGFGTAISRALFSVPGHTIFAIYMGYYYGLARHAEAYNDSRLTKKHLKKALFVPVMIHGFYDFCLDTGMDIMLLVFLVFEVVITILAIRQTRRLSNIHVEIPADPFIAQNTADNTPESTVTTATPPDTNPPS